MINNRQKKYVNRDYDDLKNELLNLSKQYFPNFFNDFSEYSLEAMLIEMISYVGDNLNFYLDDKYKQLFIQHADDLESMYRIAKSKGYKPQTVSVAYGDVEVSQIVPAIIENDEYVPDLSYAGLIKKGSVFSDTVRENYYTVIQDNSMSNYDDIEVETYDASNPSFYRIYKNIKVRSGEDAEKRIQITDVEQYKTIELDNNVAYVQSIVDSDDNEWFEVDFLAQDTIFDEVRVGSIYKTQNVDTSQTQYILKPKQVKRRFVVDHKASGKCVLKFGSGIDTLDDELNQLSADDLLTTNSLSQLQLSSNFAVENFLKNDSFGLVPYNTELTVKYVKSKGEEENTNSNTVTNIIDLFVDFESSPTSQIEESFTVNNNNPIIGSSFLNSLEKLRNESYEAFYSQRRCVTEKDFILRVKLLPTKYGSFSKVFVEKDYVSRTSSNVGNSLKKDLKSINIYVLSKSSDGFMVRSDDYAKENLRNYLSEYKMISDTLNIIDAYIINIGVDFDFVAKSEYNSDEVLLNISQKIEDYFNIDRWELNQPLVVEELRMEMLSAEGVASVSNIQFKNKFDTESDYSPIKYDVEVGGSNYDAKRGIIYPPADVGIFELKFPEQDIRGKHV